MKTCIRCNQVKPFEAFYKHKGMKDGVRKGNRNMDTYFSVSGF